MYAAYRYYVELIVQNDFEIKGLYGVRHLPKK